MIIKPANVCAALVALLGAGCGDRADLPADAAHRANGERGEVVAESPRYADQNRDGRVTRAEAEQDPALAATFDRYDDDADGALDRGEFARLEAGATDQADDDAARHTLRPRSEYPRPYE